MSAPLKTEDMNGIGASKSAPRVYLDPGSPARRSRLPYSYDRRDACVVCHRNRASMDRTGVEPVTVSPAASA